MKSRIILVLAVLSVTVLAVPVDAAPLLCLQRSGRLVVRDDPCRPREVQITDPAQIGLPTPPAPDISARVSQSTDTPIPDSTYVALPFDTVEFDTDGIFNPITPTRLTAQTSGKYLIIGYVEIATSFTTTGYREVAIWLNGSTRIAREVHVPSATAPTLTTISTYYFLNVNDYVELAVIQTSGSTLTVHAPEPPAFMMVKLP